MLSLCRYMTAVNIESEKAPGSHEAPAVVALRQADNLPIEKEHKTTFFKVVGWVFKIRQHKEAGLVSDMVRSRPQGGK